MKICNELISDDVGSNQNMLDPKQPVKQECTDMQSKYMSKKGTFMSFLGQSNFFSNMYPILSCTFVRC
jgi:hypothetical protein